jgi:hypothetical protein
MLLDRFGKGDALRWLAEDENLCESTDCSLVFFSGFALFSCGKRQT